MGFLFKIKSIFGLKTSKVKETSNTEVEEEIVEHPTKENIEEKYQVGDTVVCTKAEVPKEGKWIKSRNQSKPVKIFPALFAKIKYNHDRIFKPVIVNCSHGHFNEDHTWTIDTIPDEPVTFTFLFKPGCGIPCCISGYKFTCDDPHIAQWTLHGKREDGTWDRLSSKKGIKDDALFDEKFAIVVSHVNTLYYSFKLTVSQWSEAEKYELPDKIVQFYTHLKNEFNFPVAPEELPEGVGMYIKYEKN